MTLRVDFFDATKSMSPYVRWSESGRSPARSRTATPPIRRSGMPASIAAVRTRDPSAVTSASRPSEEADGLTPFVDVHAHGRGRLAIAGHRLHVAAECDDPPGAGV